MNLMSATVRQQKQFTRWPVDFTKVDFMNILVTVVPRLSSAQRILNFMHIDVGYWVGLCLKPQFDSMSLP
jgi:hypothetical protein